MRGLLWGGGVAGCGTTTGGGSRQVVMHAVQCGEGGVS